MLTTSVPASPETYVEAELDHKHLKRRFVHGSLATFVAQIWQNFVREGTTL